MPWVQMVNKQAVVCEVNVPRRHCIVKGIKRLPVRMDTLPDKNPKKDAKVIETRGMRNRRSTQDLPSSFCTIYTAGTVSFLLAGALTNPSWSSFDSSSRVLPFVSGMRRVEKIPVNMKRLLTAK